MGTILWQLAELGYGWAYRVLDAQYFGVAQRRRRVFIVGHLGTSGERAGAVLFEPDSLPWHPAPRRETGEDVARAVVSRIGKGGFTDPVNDNIIAPAPVVESRSVALTGIGEYKFGIGTLRSSSGDAGGGSEVLVFEPRYARNGRGAPDVIAPPLKAQNGGTGKGDGAPVVYSIKTAQTGSNGWGVNEDMMNTLDGANGFAIAFQSSQSGIREVDQHATLDSNNGSRRHNGVIQNGVRRLTPTECERLQGFPDGHTAGQSDSARYKQLGNAVAVPVAEWIGRRIVEVASS